MVENVAELNNNILKLKFDYEDTGNCRTYYKGEYKNKKYNIVILHWQVDEICTATKDGEPCSDLRTGIEVELYDKKYKTVKKNGYTVLEEV